MDLDTEVWTRNSFDVEAVRITEYNFRQVAEWCGGTVAKTTTDNPRFYVAVTVARGTRERQSRVFVNDWMVLANGRFKHYRNDSIKMVYHKKAIIDTRQEVRELVQQAILVIPEEAEVPYPELVNILTDRFMALVGGSDE